MPRWADPVRLMIVDSLVVIGSIAGRTTTTDRDRVEPVGAPPRRARTGRNDQPHSIERGRSPSLRAPRTARRSNDARPGQRRTRRSGALFVCTRNSARSQLAAALWRSVTSVPAESAGTHPADRVARPARSQPPVARGCRSPPMTPRSIDDVPSMPPLVDHGLRPGARGTRPTRRLAALVDSRPGRDRVGSRLRRHDRRAAPTSRRARGRIGPSVSVPDDPQLDVEVETGTGAMRLDLPRRLVAEALGTGFLIVAVIGSGIMASRLSPERRRPAAARERSRHRRRPDRPDPDARRRLRGALQPGRHPHRPAESARSRPATASATSPPRSSVDASGRSSPT